MTASIPHRMVDEVMTPYVITCSTYTSLAEVNEIMVKNFIRRLPVLEEGKLVGIVTRKDVLEAEPSLAGRFHNAAELHEALGSIAVQEVMTRAPLTVYRTDALGHAAERMLDHKVGGLPVIGQNGALVGLITESDIFRTIVRQWRDDNLLFSGAKVRSGSAP